MTENLTKLHNLLLEINKHDGLLDKLNNELNNKKYLFIPLEMTDMTDLPQDLPIYGDVYLSKIYYHSWVLYGEVDYMWILTFKTDISITSMETHLKALPYKGVCKLIEIILDISNTTKLYKNINS